MTQPPSQPPAAMPPGQPPGQPRGESSGAMPPSPLPSPPAGPPGPPSEALLPSQRPGLPYDEQIRGTAATRDQTDYIFRFWTALGWTILTLGIFSFYIFYQLVRRSRDHTLRRADQLDAAAVYAWERANAAGRAEELRPSFERVGGHVAELRRLTLGFRDPTYWLLVLIGASIAGLGSVAWLAGVIMVDSDLVHHDRAEIAAENELATIYGRLGHPLPMTDWAEAKQPHNYVLRVLVFFLTGGIYGLWWLYNIMAEGNAHYARNWRWEEALVGATTPAA